MTAIVPSSTLKPLPPKPSPSPARRLQHPQTSNSRLQIQLTTPPPSPPFANRQAAHALHNNKPLPATPPGAPQPQRHNQTPHLFTPPSAMAPGEVDTKVMLWIDANTDVVANPGDECPICLDSYTTEETLRLKVVGCDHCIGRNCLMKLLKTDLIRDSKCPLCRATWMPAIRRLSLIPRRDGQVSFDEQLRIIEQNWAAISAVPALELDVPSPEESAEERRALFSYRHLRSMAAGNSDDDSFDDITRDIAEVRARARASDMTLRRHRRGEDDAGPGDPLGVRSRVASLVHNRTANTAAGTRATALQSMRAALQDTDPAITATRPPGRPIATPTPRIYRQTLDRARDYRNPFITSPSPPSSPVMDPAGDVDPFSSNDGEFAAHLALARHRESERARETKKQQVKRNIEKERELKEFEKRLIARERAVIDRELRVSERENMVKRKEELRETQKREMDILMTRHRADYRSL